MSETAVLKEKESSRILSSFEIELGELNIQIDRLDKAVHQIVSSQPGINKDKDIGIERAKTRDIFVDQVQDKIAGLRTLNARFRTIVNDLETF